MHILLRVNHYLYIYGLVRVNTSYLEMPDDDGLTLLINMHFLGEWGNAEVLDYILSMILLQTKLYLFLFDFIRPNFMSITIFRSLELIKCHIMHS